MNAQNHANGLTQIGDLMTKGFSSASKMDSTQTKKQSNSSNTGQDAESQWQTGNQRLETLYADSVLEKFKEVTPINQDRDTDIHQLANRAMSAASWLLSNPQKIMKMDSSYGLVYNEKTQTDDWAPIAPILTFNNEMISGQLKKRLPSLMSIASQVELIFHLNRLLLHRRKASLGEATMPMFIADLAGDLRRMQVTSLGAALLVDHLRTRPRNEWFPAWPEIESAATAIENGITDIRKHLEDVPDMIEKRTQEHLVEKDHQHTESQEFKMSQECLFAWITISKQRSLTDDELESWKRGEMPKDEGNLFS